MNEPDPDALLRDSKMDALLREWRAPDPPEALDHRVLAGYRSVKPSDRGFSWRRLWTMRVTVPAPALLAAALAVFALFLWLRPAPAPAPQTPNAVTRLNITGFQPLPNGEARVVPAVEVKR